MKTGIVLEGGAVRTIFSTGVCDALLTRDLLPDYVIGVSAGIAYGVSYVSKQSRRNLDIMVNYINDKRYMGFGNLLRRDNRAYFGLDFVFGTIPNELIPFDYDTFAAYPGEVEAVVTNLDTGKAEYFPVERRDDRFKLLQATCALPFLFPVFDIQGKPCMDGGAADAIPYERALERGCERVIVVLTRERSYVRRPESSSPSSTRPTGSTPGSAIPCAAGRTPTTPPGSGCFSLRGRGGPSCLPPTARRAFTAPKRTWRRFGRCGRTAMTRAWSGWTRCRPS